MSDEQASLTGRCLGPTTSNGYWAVADGRGVRGRAHRQRVDRCGQADVGPVQQRPVFRERMKREARIAGRLQEPHVVPIHEYGESTEKCLWRCASSRAPT